MTPHFAGPLQVVLGPACDGGYYLIGMTRLPDGVLQVLSPPFPVHGCDPPSSLFCCFSCSYPQNTLRAHSQGERGEGASASNDLVFAPSISQTCPKEAFLVAVAISGRQTRARPRTQGTVPEPHDRGGVCIFALRCIAPSSPSPTCSSLLLPCIPRAAAGFYPF